MRQSLKQFGEALRNVIGFFIGATAVFWFMPMLISEADSPCDALIRRMISEGQKEGSLSSDGVPFIAAIGKPFLEARVASLYPGISPPLVCGMIYWRGLIDPQSMREAFSGNGRSANGSELLQAIPQNTAPD